MRAMTRRRFMQHASAAAAFALLPSAARADEAVSPLIDRLLEQFVKEAIVPAGGVDRSKSIWQVPGRGAATGSEMFAGVIDPRYFRFEVEALYRFARVRGNEMYRNVADAQVNYMAANVHEK